MGGLRAADEVLQLYFRDTKSLVISSCVVVIQSSFIYRGTPQLKLHIGAFENQEELLP